MRGGPLHATQAFRGRDERLDLRRAVTGLEARYSASKSPRTLYRPPARSEPILESAVAE